MKHAVGIASAIHPGEDETFSPDQYFLGLARRAAAGTAATRISLGGMGEVVIDPKRRRYKAFVRDLETFCRTPADHFEIATGQRISAPGNDPARNVDELLWTAAYHASAGRLLAGCSKYDVVKLAYWPNLTRLPATPNTVNLCAFLSRRPSAIHLARKLLRVGAGEAYSFYSAALSAGAVVPLSRLPERNDSKPEPASPASTRSGMRVLWNKISTP